MFPKKVALNSDNLYCIQLDSNAKANLRTAVRGGNTTEIEQAVNDLGIDGAVVFYGQVLDERDEPLTVIGVISDKVYSTTLNDIMEDTLFTKVEHVPSIISNARKPRRRSVKVTERDFGIQKRKHDWQFKK